MKTSLICILFICFGILSCQNQRKVAFKHSSVIGNKEKITTIYLRIPKGYKYSGIKADAESGLENQYRFADSSVIYLTDFVGTINASIINDNQLDYNKRFSADTAIFKGVMKNGKYWKEVKYFNLFYGYYDVPLISKDKYDRILNKIEIREK